MLSWPEGAEHLVRGFVEVLREGLQVSIREARHAWDRVFFVGLDCCRLVVEGGRLSEDLG